MKRSVLTDSLLIFVLAALLIGPLFRVKYLDNWASIESTFISDARMLSEHLPHTGWQPLWYCGTRFDYVYPPGLRYGPALLAKAAGLTTAKAYHIYTATLYAFGIAAVYLLVMAGCGSRWSAALSAAGVALVSPSYLFLPRFRIDSPYWVPQRLHVLLTYGEGPHITALSLLGAALALSFLALRGRNPAPLAGAAVMSALVVAHNFYGATALAIFFPILTWSIWVCQRETRIWWRALTIAAIAWGLCAPWLTPSYVQITLTDMKWVAEPGNSAATIALSIAGVVFAAASYKFGAPGRDWVLFLAGSLLFFFIDVAGLEAFSFHATGNAARFVPELDFVLLLAFFETARRLWPQWSVPVALAVLALFFPASHYVKRAWTLFPRAGSLESQYPYQMASWVHDNLPGQRVLASGEVRYWFDTWFDNPQLDGGSAQGMENQTIPIVVWSAHTMQAAQPTKLWLQALGTSAIIVSDSTSLEHYRMDFQYPARFRGVLPALFDDGHGTVIYQVPRVHPSIGRVVNRAAIAGTNQQDLGSYVQAVETPDQPVVNVAWKGFDEVALSTVTSTGQSLLFQETWDSGWHAFENGKEIPVRVEPVMDFMLLDVPPGPHAITMRFETPLENRAGVVLLFGSLLAITGLISSAWRAVRELRPASATASSAQPL